MRLCLSSTNKVIQTVPNPNQLKLASRCYPLHQAVPLEALGAVAILIAVGRYLNEL